MDNIRDAVASASREARSWLLDPRPRLYSKFVVEFAACMMFHFIGSISPTPWANGIALIVLVYYTAKTSGAHLNPAITLTFTMLGYTNPLEMLVYWAAQIGGCILGALWIALLVPDLNIGQSITRGDDDAHDGCFVPRDGLAPKYVFGWEALCTFNFIAPIFSVVWYTYRKKGYGNTGPLLVGMSLMANAFVAGKFTGAALNPARVLGSYIVFDCNNQAVVGHYIVGEMLAGFLVPFMIVPWYGICPDSWYMRYIPMAIKLRMKAYQGSLHITDPGPLPEMRIELTSSGSTV